MDAKESLLSIAGRQQRQGKVGAEDIPDGQVSQALGCHSTALSKGQAQQADAVGRRGADAHRHGGPVLHGAVCGRAVSQCHLDMQPVDAGTVDIQLPLLQPWSMSEGSSQGWAGCPAQYEVFPRNWGQKMKGKRMEVRQAVALRTGDLKGGRRRKKRGRWMGTQDAGGGREMEKEEMERD